MNEEAKRIIRDEIAPAVQSGRVALFLGAGFSVGTSNLAGSGIPSSPDLVQRILVASGNTDQDPNSVDLPLAFSIGVDEINDFERFLANNFTCNDIRPWQRQILKYWWRRVYTTNIDTVLNKAIETLNSSNEGPKYRVFNYRDRMPVLSSFLEPPIVYLHGTILDPQAGFVFDGVHYADHSVKGGDWLYDAALSLTHGHCLIIGSRLKESDLESEIRKRLLWDQSQFTPYNNWIVLNKFQPLEIKGYAKRGIISVEANADEFVEYLTQHLTVMSSGKMLKKIAPHLLLEAKDTPSGAWFNSCFDHIPTLVNQKKSSKGIYSRYFTGDEPDWFYIVNDVPAKFDFIDEVLKKVESFIADNKRSVLAVAVTGRVGSGKTTAYRLIMRQLSLLTDTTYEYKSYDGVDIEAAWSVIRNINGTLVLGFDSSHEHFYAVNELARRLLSSKTDTKAIFLLEERDLLYKRNRHHLNVFQDDKLLNCKIPQLTVQNSKNLLNKMLSVGLRPHDMEDIDAAAKHICDTEKGLRGDLLATLCHVISGMPFERQLDAEYLEIQQIDALRVYKMMTLVTSARMSIPIQYLAEIYKLETSYVFKLLNEELQGKVYFHNDGYHVSTRHAIIAQYHISKFVAADEKEGLVVNLMKCVSGKYTIDDIRVHPLPYRLYKAILQNHFLSNIVLKGRPDLIENIYSYCQGMFHNDGIFWLQYGRFLFYRSRYREAEHCLRKGWGIYDSYQIKHALAQVLLKIYVKEGFSDPNLLEEGRAIFENEIASRGVTDPYPFNTYAQCLTDIVEIMPDKELVEVLKSVINAGLKHHKDDQEIQAVFKRYLSLKL